MIKDKHYFARPPLGDLGQLACRYVSRGAALKIDPRIWIKE